MSSWLVVTATFLAAGVEWVEALTIVLAVGTFKSWRTALLATAAALTSLVALVLVFGITVTTYISISLFRTLVGAGLLLFGLGWLYKAILRSSGLKALHDEDEAYDETREELMTHGHAFGTAFSGVFLEGLEVVFIVIALGGLNSVFAATVGALLSLVVVVVAGFFVRHPLSRVPENTLKYAVGVMLTSFGTFFAGEGLGVTWWQADLVLLPLIGSYALISLLLVQYLRRRTASSLAGSNLPVRYARAALREIWSLFVTDGLLALFVVAVLLAIPVLIDRLKVQPTAAGGLLVAGVCVAVLVAVKRADGATSRRISKSAADAAALRESPVSEPANF
jgi:Ca2+/H+ antiporter, TMEM165/GDT1 family